MGPSSTSPSVNFTSVNSSDTVALTRNQAIDAVVSNRTAQWENMINSELQSLITRAATIREEISSAKTQTKKRYFEKKFAKVSTEVRQMIVALQRVQSTATNQNVPQQDDTIVTDTEQSN